MFWGVWYTVGKVFSKTFHRYITSPKIPRVSLGKSRKINLQLFSDCRAWWSKEPQWENDCGSFSPCFLLVMGKEKQRQYTHEMKRKIQVFGVPCKLQWVGGFVCILHNLACLRPSCKMTFLEELNWVHIHLLRNKISWRLKNLRCIPDVMFELSIIICCWKSIVGNFLKWRPQCQMLVGLQKESLGGHCWQNFTNDLSPRVYMWLSLTTFGVVEA